MVEADLPRLCPPPVRLAASRDPIHKLPDTPNVALIDAVQKILRHFAAQFKSGPRPGPAGSNCNPWSQNGLGLLRSVGRRRSLGSSSCSPPHPSHCHPHHHPHASLSSLTFLSSSPPDLDGDESDQVTTCGEAQHCGRCPSWSYQNYGELAQMGSPLLLCLLCFRPWDYRWSWRRRRNHNWRWWVPCNGILDKSTLPRKEEAEKAPSEGGLLPLSLLKAYRSIMLETNSPTLTWTMRNIMQRQHQYWSLTMKIIGAQRGWAVRVVKALANL